MKRLTIIVLIICFLLTACAFDNDGQGNISIEENSNDIIDASVLSEITNDSQSSPIVSQLEEILEKEQSI